jgi:FtsP/CotA-like multicopper oxidase with cupredoxin domain
LRYARREVGEPVYRDIFVLAPGNRADLFVQPLASVDFTLRTLANDCGSMGMMLGAGAASSSGETNLAMAQLAAGAAPGATSPRTGSGPSPSPWAWGWECGRRYELRVRRPAVRPRPRGPTSCCGHRRGVDGRQHLADGPTYSQVTVRIRFADFDGTTVYHCQILDHEVQGMMGLIDAR